LKLSTHTKEFKKPLYLQSGRILEPYEIIYETYGELNEEKSNVILICHALSGSHHAAGRYEGDRKSGWWDAFIGDNKAIDTTKYFVISTNVIGSCFGSTGPMSNIFPTEQPYRLKFPVVTIKDMVRAQKILLSSLGIESVEAVVGGSMGGMQALRFALDYPNFAKKIIVLASTHSTRDWVIAFNKITSEAIRKDPDFKEGNYDPKDIAQNGLSGLAIGRMGGHISFLSHHSMERKFRKEYVSDDGLYELFGRFQVEKYLEYNGYNFTKWFDPLSYLYITKAINIFDLSHGYDSLQDALKRFKSQIYLFGFDNDLLFLPDEMREVKLAMDDIGNGELAHYYHIDSDYGHDAFLVEVPKFENIVADILGDKA
jgi:homoserine O-acetyltransferase